MKNIYKKGLSFLLVLSFLLSLCPLPSFASDNNLVSYGDFEDEYSENVWTGGTRDAVASYEGNWGMQVINPFGDIHSSYGHILEYSERIHLKEGNFYTFYAYVSNPMGGDSTPTAQAYMGRNGDELYIDIASIGSDYALVSASFMTTEDTDPTLIITFDGGDSDVGFSIDSVSIVPETRTPSYTRISGPSSVFIPENGHSDYVFTLTTYDSDDLPINILASSLSVTTENLPDGVLFDTSTGRLRVLPTAPADCEFTITASALVGNKTETDSITVVTTKNLLSDPSFDNPSNLWQSDDSLDYADGFLSLYASKQGEWGQYASVSYTKQLLLLEGYMYVFRADVKSDDEFSSSQVYISNLSFAQSGYAEINVTGVGGDKERVTSAFLIEDTGLYDLTLNFYAPTERPIYIDNVFLGVENPAPTSLSIHAPGNVQIPTEQTILPCYSNVLNQLGDVMEGCTPTLSVSPQGNGVYLENGEIIVLHNAKAGEYTVRAEYADLSRELVISVSDNAIGDGGFEEKEANEWWTSSDGSIFSIIDYDGDKAGHIYSPDKECLVVNNSYMELVGGEYYVYSAAAGFGEGSITAFIADAYSGEYIPFAQYNPLEDTRIPFSVDETIVGRLVLHIKSDNFVGLIFDDISIIPAELSATDIVVTGGEYGDFLKGSYSYVNNMTDEPDADISATRWYISSSYDGRYEPIGIPNQNYLEFTEDMVGQYIVYEVTPICAYTGVVGESLRSLPVHIAVDVALDPDSDVPLSQMAPVELEATAEHPYIDITSHWCEGMIASLSAAGVVSGRTHNRFAPDTYVTRGEFAAMVARAFSLVSMPYSDCFDDVSSSDWYSGWIETCYRRGIIKGVSNTTFLPDKPITREEMATIIYRAYILSGGQMPYELALKYYDAFMISPWAYESVKTCTNLNILTGIDSNLCKPQSNATRAEAVAMIYRTLKSF